jgi:hypothetical protein
MWYKALWLKLIQLRPQYNWIGIDKGKFISESKIQVKISVWLICINWLELAYFVSGNDGKVIIITLENWKNIKNKRWFWFVLWWKILSNSSLKLTMLWIHIFWDVLVCRFVTESCGVSFGDWIMWCVAWWLNHVVCRLVTESCGVSFGDWIMWCVAWWLNHVVCCLVTESCCVSFGDWIMWCVAWWLNHVVCCLVTESCCVSFGDWIMWCVIWWLNHVVCCLVAESCGVLFGDWIMLCVIWWLNHAMCHLVTESCGVLLGDWIMCCVIWWLNQVVCYLVTESCCVSFGDWIMPCVIWWLNQVVCYVVIESFCPHLQAQSCETLRNTHLMTQYHIPESLNPLSNITVKTPDLTQRGWFFQALVHVIWILEIWFLWLCLDITWMNSLMSNVNTSNM